MNQAPEILNTSDLDPNYMWGPKFTIGFQEDSSIVEVTGFYLCQTNATTQISDISRIDLPFAVFPQPIGFLGNNNLFLQADHYDVALRDFGLLLGALTLARLATGFERDRAA